jgi:hypothetical protein
LALKAILTDIISHLPGGTASLIGPEFVRDLATKPPRVIWIPGKDRWVAPDDPGADPRPLWTRAAGVEVHIWGADYDATEDLINGVATAIHEGSQLWGGYAAVGDAGWPTLDGRFTALGRLYVMNVEFFIPVTAQPFTRGLVTSIPQTGVLVTGVPPTDSNG